MKPLTVAVQYLPGNSFEKIITGFAGSSLVEEVIVVAGEPVGIGIPRCRVLAAPPMQAQETLDAVLRDVATPYLLIMPGPGSVIVDDEGLDRIVNEASSTKAGLVYSDFYEESPAGRTVHRLGDYLPGSVRDDFDFGAMMLYSLAAVREGFRKYGPLPPVRSAGLYDVRLKVSVDHEIRHLPLPLYSMVPIRPGSAGEAHFAYVDPKNKDVQREMEEVFTNHLKSIGAYLPSRCLRNPAGEEDVYPVEASVIIPVRNRVSTVADAVESAISQQTDFPFNVIVVDNHSTDGTTALLAGLALRHASLHHVISGRTDLGIGGCWNEAVRSPLCGRYAVQLDSDDLYRSVKTLQTIIDMFHRERCAMVIGAYTIVDFALNEIPPGLIDHREWTDDNGHNNALRINGLGAPRSFDTAVIRSIGFPNVSYGEDYAVALRICREYRIGRIFESLYLCRRWQGNTDAALSVEATNGNNAFKDKVRTDEILARQEMNKRERGKTV